MSYQLNAWYVAAWANGLKNQWRQLQIHGS
jgi:hypothetical protein